MMEYLGEVDLSLEQAALITKALWKVAQADGVIHEKEKALIETFYSACAEEAGKTAQSFADQPFELEEAQRLFTTPEAKDALLRTCLLLGYADGQYSGDEREVIGAMAAGLAVDAAHLEGLEQEVKKGMLKQFSGLALFKDAAYAIGTRLGFTKAQIDEVLG